MADTPPSTEAAPPRSGGSDSGNMGNIFLAVFVLAVLGGAAYYYYYYVYTPVAADGADGASAAATPPVPTAEASAAAAAGAAASPTFTAPKPKVVWHHQDKACDKIQNKANWGEYMQKHNAETGKASCWYQVCARPKVNAQGKPVTGHGEADQEEVNPALCNMTPKGKFRGCVEVLKANCKERPISTNMACMTKPYTALGKDALAKARKDMGCK